MKLSQFDFNLPKSLISFYPNFVRSQCRLMIVNGSTGQILHKFFFNIIDYIYPGDLIILNDTQVMPARLYGQKKNGKKIECLVERIISYNKILVKFKKKEDLHIGTDIFFGKYHEIKTSIISKKKSFFEILFYDSTRSIIDLINFIGMIPLPPYIKRPVYSLDQNLYQTVYKKNIGSIAAPTAGLHFDLPLLDKLSKKGIEIDFLTLHIGYGTFQPIQTPNIIDHVMHTELVYISSTIIEKIKACKKKGGRIIAVGTSTLRALESLYHAPAWKNTQHFVGETNIFIYPGYQHNIVDALITNFHVPKSTLIMLIASFVGYKNTMHAYIEAIKKKYYFLSYGDAMYITYNNKAKYEKIL